MFQKEFRITNITCEACVKLSKMTLEGIKGVTEASVDLKTGKAVIMSDREISRGEINRNLLEIDKITDL